MLRNDSSNSIIELQHKLMKAQYGEDYGKKIKSYTASSKCQKDIESLSKIGLNIQEISDTLDIPVSYAERQIARIERHNEARNRFLRTGRLPTPGVGVFTIFQR